MIESVIPVREVSLVGDLKVKRVLPHRSRRMIGPFAFLDEMGPIALRPGKGGDVPPHPHIGLATVTYLFDGELLHRDSIGNKQAILPGDVNWMSAGRGIAHSERIPATLRSDDCQLHGLQAWVALPKEFEETEPSFDHYERGTLPEFTHDGVGIRLIAGSAFGRQSPVKSHSPIFYFDARMPAGTSLNYVPESGHEAGFYLLQGQVEIDGATHEGPLLFFFKSGEKIRITANQDSHGVFLGGQPLESPRFIWWNFVSSSKERIEQAKRDWREQRFPKIPEEIEFVPLPGESAPTEKSTFP